MLRIALTSAETDEALESGGLSSLGRHSDAGMTPRDPAWKHALRSFILYIASLITLLVLDAIWMKGIAPALGVDYFAVVKASSAIASSAPKLSWVPHDRAYQEASMLALHERPVLRPPEVPLVFQLCMTPADARLMACKLCKEQPQLGS